MATNVERISSLPTALSQSGPQGSPAASANSRKTPAPVDRAADDYRLVIEQDAHTGSYVYKTLDRTTGEVVAQFPREEVLKLRDNPAYEAGRVIVTKA
ncbi:MAG: flagellar protein FlaG [Caulobacteraceae bacterium]|nr:flagellar protein FlaG [Caulobacteraceae bacterium]